MTNKVLTLPGEDGLSWFTIPFDSIDTVEFRKTVDNKVSMRVHLRSGKLIVSKDSDEVTPEEAADAMAELLT